MGGKFSCDTPTDAGPWRRQLPFPNRNKAEKPLAFRLVSGRRKNRVQADFEPYSERQKADEFSLFLVALTRVEPKFNQTDLVLLCELFINLLKPFWIIAPEKMISSFIL